LGHGVVVEEEEEEGNRKEEIFEPAYFKYSQIVIMPSATKATIFRSSLIQFRHQ